MLPTGNLTLLTLAYVRTNLFTFSSIKLYPYTFKKNTDSQKSAF